ncbi:hypothetical protein F4777DRAFT_560590 [Nemania sp. FL0916]|nr:hypothetical protein F4777DRAFT_560590 [Nemania sp. FL0916]
MPFKFFGPDLRLTSWYHEVSALDVLLVVLLISEYSPSYGQRLQTAWLTRISPSTLQSRYGVGTQPNLHRANLRGDSDRVSLL